MGRVYTITAEGMGLSDSVIGDLLVIQGAADKPFQVLSVRWSQREQETATQARFRLLRRSTADTQAAVGTVGVSKHNISDTAAAVTCTMNRTAAAPTLGTEAGIVAIQNESLPNGGAYFPAPEERQMFCGTASYFVVNLPAAHGVTGQTVTFDVTAVVEEFG